MEDVHQRAAEFNPADVVHDLEPCIQSEIQRGAEKSLSKVTSNGEETEKRAAPERVDDTLCSDISEESSESDSDEDARVICCTICLSLCSRREQSSTEESATIDELEEYAQASVTDVEPLEHYEVRDGDILVSSYPGSGLFWAYETIRMVCGPDDDETTDLPPKMDMVPPPAGDGIVVSPAETKNALESNHRVYNRIIASNYDFERLPAELLLDERATRVVYVARNPKDAWTSHYRCLHSSPEYSETWEQFLKQHIEQKNGWFSHCLKYWQMHQAKPKKIHFVKFEAMRKDLVSEILSLAAFLEQPLDQRQIDKINDQCSFERVNERLEHEMFGEVGHWRQQFLPEQALELDTMYEEKLKDSGLQFDFQK